MRSPTVVAGLMLAIVMLAAETSAAETGADPSTVPQDVLTQMGMAGMTPITDAQGHRIRGEGCGVSVFMMNLAVNWTAPTNVNQLILVGAKKPTGAFAISRNILIRWR